MTRLSAVFIATIFINSLAFAGNTGAQKPVDDLKWLFVIKAKSMEFIPSGNNPDVLEGTLIVYGVDDTAMAFTDRPYREAMTLTLEEMREWVANTFAEIRPNFAVSIDVNGELKMAVLEATSAATQTGDSLSIQVVSLLGAVPTAGGLTSLFIDQVRSPIGPGPVIGPVRPGPVRPGYPGYPGRPGPTGPVPGGPGPVRNWYCSARNSQGTVFVGVANIQSTAANFAMQKCVGYCNITGCALR